MELTIEKIRTAKNLALKWAQKRRTYLEPGPMKIGNIDIPALIKAEAADETRIEFYSFIDGLTRQEKAELTALFWLGRQFPGAEATVEDDTEEHDFQERAYEDEGDEDEPREDYFGIWQVLTDDARLQNPNNTAFYLEGKRGEHFAECLSRGLELLAS